jgi:HYR domain
MGVVKAGWRSYWTLVVAVPCAAVFVVGAGAASTSRQAQTGALQTKENAVTTSVSAAVTAVPRTANSAAGTVQLRVAIPWNSFPADRCPAGLPATVLCDMHPGGPVVTQGLGFVNQAYTYPVETLPARCLAGMFNLHPYAARLIVRDKGELALALAGVETCLEGPPVDTVLSPTQGFSVTGGTGVFAGASGSGQVSRMNIRRESSGQGAGTDVWEGSITAPNLDLDLTPPTITGARAKVVRAPRTAKRVAVRYRVVARDDVDGALAVTCTPRSGSLFRVGRRTVVRCSATDKSANTTSASFTITIKRR